MKITISKLRRLIRETVEAVMQDMTSSEDFPYTCGCGEEWKTLDSALACRDCVRRIEDGGDGIPVVYTGSDPAAAAEVERLQGVTG